VLHACSLCQWIVFLRVGAIGNLHLLLGMLLTQLMPDFGIHFVL